MTNFQKCDRVVIAAGESSEHITTIGGFSTGKVKFVSVLVCLALLLSAVPGAVMGQEPSPPQDLGQKMMGEDPLGEDDMELAKTAGTTFIKTAVEVHPEWEEALLVEGKELYDLEGQVIAYLFTLSEDEQAIGRVVVGSSAYNYDVLEVGAALAPPLPDRQERFDVPLGLQVGAEPMLVYLGYDKFLAIYPTERGVVGLDLHTGHVIKATDVQNQMVSPEEYQRQQEKRLQALPVGGVKGYTWYSLDVPLYDMNDPSGYSNNCGPTSGAMVAGYYKEHGYPNFDGWDTNHNQLYNYMQTNSWGGPGTAPWKAGPGFTGYAASKGYNGFWSNYYVAYSELYGSIRGSLYSGRPLLIMFGWGGSYAEWHYCAISGFVDFSPQGGARYIFVKNPWYTEDYVNYDAEIGVATIHFIFPG